MKQIIEFILNLFRPKPQPIFVPPDIPAMPEPKPIPPPPTPPSKRQILHETALSCLGTDVSPRDVAPDELACAESVSNVLLKAGLGVGIIVGTLQLRNTLAHDIRFKKVFAFVPGAVIISATGLGTGRIEHGHVGITGENATIMSNDSMTGKWRQNYSLASWVAYFQIRGGFPIEFFVPV